MGNIQTTPYLFFNGQAREAIKFYQNIFGGKLFIQTNGEAGAVSEDRPADHIMHAALTEGEVNLYVSDGASASDRSAKIVICLSGNEEEKLRTIFEKLSENVKVDFPLKKEGWGDVFGSLRDKYGVEWMVNISAN